MAARRLAATATNLAAADRQNQNTCPQELIPGTNHHEICLNLLTAMVAAAQEFRHAVLKTSQHFRISALGLARIFRCQLDTSRLNYMDVEATHPKVA